MTFENFVQWAFYSLITGVAIYGVNVLAKMKDSIEMLNVQIAILLTKDEAREKQLEKHDVRISRLEEKV